MAIETFLKTSLEKHLKNQEGITPSNLAESIRYSLLSPGKRIRPRLLLACGEMVGLSVSELAPAAAALEMIHCFTLIHDDLPCMDNDDFRRGMPSNHKKFGEGLALLAGDALMALAIEVFMDSPVDSSRLVAGLKHLVGAMGPRGVIGGQAAESLLGKNSQLKELQQMHRQKTGALFSAAILIPKEFCGIPDVSQPGQALISFGHELGLAFQVADDLEDLPVYTAEKKPFPPTHILSYLSPQETSEITSKNLKNASSLLLEAWGSQARGLIQIADEVIKKTDIAIGKRT
jgi:geranylgeranyl diphosphate synthase type II